MPQLKLEELTGQSQFIPMSIFSWLHPPEDSDNWSQLERQSAIVFDTRLDSGDVVQSLGVSQTAG